MQEMIKQEFSTGEELVNLIDLSSKGPVYYHCKDTLLGEGGYGKVFKGYAVTGKTTIPVAMKFGNLNDVTDFHKDKHLGVIPREVYILKHLPKHSSAIRLLHYEKISPSKYVIIMDRPQRSKNLYSLRGERFFPFTEKKAKMIIKDLSSLLLKMERMGIIHGDIKPRNVIYDLENGTCKLVDFGLARYIHKGELLDQFQGTQSFMPPEFLINGQYDPRHETVWGLGIVTYYLLTGCRPHEDAQQALLRPYRKPTHLKHFPADAKDLVERMLAVNPNKRPRLKDILNHPWITGRRLGPLQSFSQYLIWKTKT